MVAIDHDRRDAGRHTPATAARFGRAHQPIARARPGRGGVHIVGRASHLAPRRSPSPGCGSRGDRREVFRPTRIAEGITLSGAPCRRRLQMNVVIRLHSTGSQAFATSAASRPARGGLPPDSFRHRSARLTSVRRRETIGAGGRAVVGQAPRANVRAGLIGEMTVTPSVPRPADDGSALATCHSARMGEHDGDDGRR
jgi:hypothetical protein